MQFSSGPAGVTVKGVGNSDRWRPWRGPKRPFSVGNFQSVFEKCPDSVRSQTTGCAPYSRYNPLPGATFPGISFYL